MTRWEILTWTAILILGPGAIGIFILFLRDAKRFFNELERKLAE